MKGKNLILVGLIGFIVGLLLVLFRTSLASGGVVVAAGILFVAAGVMNMTVFLGARDKKGKARMGAWGTAFGWIASGAAVVLGLAMLLFKSDFVALIGFMFAVLILFAALFQLFLLIFGTRPVKISSWFFLLPLVLIGAAVYIFLRNPDAQGETVNILITGISFILFGIVTVIEGVAVGQTNRMLKRAPAAEPAAPAPAPAPAPTPKDFVEPKDSEKK